ncbi:MAG: lysylphosphatidylglycerol synthase transmembrane domain-containing protein [Luteolibacter sp.]
MNKGRAKSLGIFALKLVGTILFLWWALSQVEDKDALWENFRLAIGSPGWVAVGVGFAFLSILANAFRWYFLLLAQSIRQPFSYIFRLTLYGAFFNIASLGGAAGDAAKILLLIRRVPGKKVGITMSVMVDHIVGFISSGIIFLVFTWGFRTIDSADDLAGRGTFIAATWFQAGGIIGIVLSIFSCSPGMLKWGRKHLPKITNNRWIDMITSALDLYRTGWRFVFWSLLASFVLSASFYLTFFAGLRSLGQPVAASDIMSVMPIVDVVTALPISVSGLGVRERTFEFLIGKLTGIPTAAAVAGSLIGFLFTLFWGLVGGLALLTARSDKKAVEAISND